MAFIDHRAADELRELREFNGYNSPEDLAKAIRVKAKTEPWGERGTVDAHTIRRIERHGHKPGPRARFVLAHFFGLRPNQLWQDRHERLVDRAAA